jgi:hypothetical protein
VPRPIATCRSTCPGPGPGRGVGAVGIDASERSHDGGSGRSRICAMWLPTAE